MQGELKISSQKIDKQKKYAVYRLKDTNQTDHSGNREYFSNSFGAVYFDDRADAEELLENIRKGLV